MEGFRIDLKIFLAWLCQTNTFKLSENKYQAGFWGDNLGPKSPNPTYSTTALYEYTILMQMFSQIRSRGCKCALYY